MSTLQNYEYIPLKDPANDIRLLKMLSPTAGTEDDSELRGELISCRREEAPHYTPVSYTWGQQDPSSTMFLKSACNVRSKGTQRPLNTVSQSSQIPDTPSPLGSRSTEPDVGAVECIPTIWRKLSIRPNLEALLRQFSKLPGSKVFWVDAICINQSDNYEKGHQVRNMDKIYRDRPLLIWLGEPTENSDVAIDMIEASPSLAGGDNFVTQSVEYLENTTKSQGLSSWKAFFDLIRRPWFSRRWIVQEFVLSKRKHVFIGDRSFNFESLIALIPLVRVSRDLHPHEFDEREGNICRETSDSSEAYDHAFPAPPLDPVDNIERLWQVFGAVLSGDTDALTLERLLDKFAAFESYDPRDGIYAFLSMASDVDGTEWIPDYSDNNTATKLYSQAVLHIMRSSGSMDIICRRIHASHFALSVSHLSSWVPWFGPQNVEFWPGHFHSIHGYNTMSLTTFGQPLNTLREGQTGHVPVFEKHARRSCDGCDAHINGTGYGCLNCPDFDYCHRCVSKSTSHHDATHQFEIYNKAVYFASSYYKLSFGSLGRDVSHISTDSCDLPCLNSGGFLVDSVRGLGEAGGESTRSASGSTLELPMEEWLTLPGMEEIGLENDGSLGNKFFRALTGNRRVFNGKVCHIPYDDLQFLRQGMNSSSTPRFAGRTELFDSISFMLSNGRRFATTQESLGFVPVGTKVGDRIAILIGCSVPVVVRMIAEAGRGSLWNLIGECYIDGLMDGESADIVQDRHLLPQAITLV